MENNIIYNWTFSDDKNRSPIWYIIAISVIIAIVFWWIFTSQYWLSIVIILASWVLFFIENNSEKNINVEITDLWIKVLENFYDFWKMENFSFIYNKENPVYLKIILNKRWIKTLILKVDNKICQDLKEILPNFIKEEKNSDLSNMDKLINILKL